jgi:hypothetical protein
MFIVIAVISLVTLTAHGMIEAVACRKMYCAYFYRLMANCVELKPGLVCDLRVV